MQCSCLLRYFVIQVFIAVPIGLGLGYYIMSGWLDNFAYRIGIGWWFFIVPSVIVLIITIMTVISQVLKTANVNPAISMRHD